MPDSRASATAFGLARRSSIVAQLAEEPLLAELKRRARASWAAGDYAEIARRELWPLGERVVARAEADGRWPALRAELTTLSDVGSSAGYLLLLGRRREAEVDTTKGA